MAWTCSVCFTTQWTTDFAGSIFLANRASPLSFSGPRRRIPAPLGITDLGHIDTVVISNNHYDHLCWHTLKHLPNRETIEVICPTGLAHWFTKREFKT